MCVMFDLEFLGDIRQGVEGCRIFEIAALTENGHTFQTYVDPYPGKAVIPSPLQPSCFHITRDFLQANAIPTIRIALEKFLQFLADIGATTITLLAHAAFRSDKPLLRRAVARAGIEWPATVRFGDTLNIARIMLPKIKKYDLASLYFRILAIKMPCPHSALYDAVALSEILSRTPNYHELTVTYAIDQIPLSSIRGIGAKSELWLMRCGFDPNDPTTHVAMDALHPSQRLALMTAIQNGVFKNNAIATTF